MEKKRSFLKLSEDTLRILIVVAGSVLSTIVLLFTAFAMVEIQKGNYQQASNFLFINFVVLGVSRLITWLRYRSKVSFLRFVVLLVFDIALGVIAYFAKDNPYFYSLCGGLFCLTIILSRVFKIIQEKYCCLLLKRVKNILSHGSWNRLP